MTGLNLLFDMKNYRIQNMGDRVECSSDSAFIFLQNSDLSRRREKVQLVYFTLSIN